MPRPFSRCYTIQETAQAVGLPERQVRQDLANGLIEPSGVRDSLGRRRSTHFEGEAVDLYKHAVQRRAAQQRAQHAKQQAAQKADEDHMKFGQAVENAKRILDRNGLEFAGAIRPKGEG